MIRSNSIRIVAISDTHGMHRQVKVSAGDVLIHAGDFTDPAGANTVSDFNRWLGALPHQNKIVVGGNHDLCLEEDRDRAAALLSSALYLQDQEVVVAGLHVYGSPWQPWYLGFAFNLASKVALRDTWSRIPVETDVLITHCPPHGILDQPRPGKHVGCEELRRAVEGLDVRTHVFGHIHESPGQLTLGGTRFVNASVCNGMYQPLNLPIVIDHPVR